MHSINEHTTAILVFALSSKEEQKHKNIDNGNELFEALSKHTLNTVQKTGLPYFHLTENEQIGNSFGERFSNAIQSIYNKGFNQIITIGNDTPQLKASHIQKAAELLAKNKMVLGPSKDGGFYLMGLQRKLFNASTFENLPWQTSRLRHQLRSELSTSIDDLILLEALIDIDNLQDLKIISKFTRQLAFHIIKIIQFIINSNTRFFKIDILCQGRFQSNIHQNRGSPIHQGV